MTITHDVWMATRDAVQHTGDRFAELVASARDPQAKATTRWSVAETAAHVAFVAWLNSSTISPSDRTDPMFAIPDLEQHLRVATVDSVAELNEMALRAYTERNPVVIAQRLRTDIGRLLDATADLDPAAPVAWLGESQVPVAGLFGHLLNELLIHGRDLARANATSWTIAPQDAAKFFELFLVGVLRCDYGRLLDSAEPARDSRIAVEFRSDYTTPITLVLHNGVVTLEEPGPGADVRVTFDPATLMLMMFGRVGKARAMFSGKVTVGGRRPWLLPVFLRTLRMPS